jgi:hypothetical protein
LLIEKNTREALRFSIERYVGLNLICATVWYRPDAGGDLRPGVGAWSAPVDKLPAIIDALMDLRAQAKRLGLIS